METEKLGMKDDDKEKGSCGIANGRTQPYTSPREEKYSRNIRGDEKDQPPIPHTTPPQTLHFHLTPTVSDSSPGGNTGALHRLRPL